MKVYNLCPTIMTKTTATGSKPLSGSYLFLKMSYFLFLLDPLDGEFVLSPPNFLKEVTKKVRKEAHQKVFCGPSKISKNISWSINICLKYFMGPARTLHPLVLYAY